MHDLHLWPEPQTGVLGNVLLRVGARTPCAFLATIGLLPLPALAAGGTTVTIVAVDESSGLGIARAYVRVENDAQSWDGYTDRHGRVTFERVPQGTYGLNARQPDYSFSGRPLELHVAGPAITVRIVGTRTRLPTIAAVESRQHSNSPQLQSNSPDALIAGTLGQALSGRAGISAGPNGWLALDGHSSQTSAVTIDGAAIFPGGFGVAASELAGDIFQSATLAGGDVAGAPDETLALRTFDPTIDWQGVVAARAASYGELSTTVQERGTAGLLGMATALSRWQGPAAFAGGYEDTSGLSYDHSSADTNASSSVTLRYPFSQDDIAFFDYGSLATAAPISCLVQLGSLPCGYGPGVSTNATLAYEQLRDEASFQNVTLDVHAFHSSLVDVFNDSGALFFGQPIGSSARTTTSRNGIAARLAFAYGNGMPATWSIARQPTRRRTLPPALRRVYRWRRRATSRPHCAPTFRSTAPAVRALASHSASTAPAISNAGTTACRYATQ